MTRRSRPKTAKQIALELDQNAQRRAQERADANRPERWGVGPNALTAPANADVSARTVGRKLYAHRVSWIDAILPKGSPEYHGVTRLSDAIATNRGEDGAERSGAIGTGSRELVTDRMIEAGKLVEFVLSLVGAHDRDLLVSLIVPSSIGQVPNGWRVVVALKTGERNHNAQGAAVRSAARNLAQAWSRLDQMPRARSVAGTHLPG